MTGIAVPRRQMHARSTGGEPDTRVLSIVVPLKDECDNVEPLYLRIKGALGNEYDWEAILVDDGSTDGTFEALQRLCALDARLKVVR